MARDPKLSELFETIQVDETEMVGYRRGLAEKLVTVESRSRRVPWPLVAMAAAALLAVFLWPRSEVTMDIDRPMTLAELMDMHNQYSNQHLLAHTQRQWQEADGFAKHNARALLTSVSAKPEAIAAAREGMVVDERPEFRAYFLEFLLDNADELVWNTVEIERLLDKEDDPLCIRLYRYLLHLSQ